jgi:glycyl-tRNA synthetase beta chain
VPTAPVSVAVALADKLDMLIGFWAIDEKPTGSKDPFALRRATLGIIRLLLQNELRFNQSSLIVRQIIIQFLKQLIRGPDINIDADIVRARFQPIVDQFLAAEFSERVSIEALTHLREKAFSITGDLLAFLADRLKVALRDQGIRHDVINACFRLGGQDDLVLLVARVRALQDFLATEDGEHLLTGYKRATNIVEDEERKDGVEYSLDPDPRLAETPAERALFAALDAAEAALGPALAAEDFGQAMTALARLRAPIDAFFDSTIVNADSPAVRRNRLCLLNRIRSVMNRVAVFSAVEGG